MILMVHADALSLRPQAEKTVTVYANTLSMQLVNAAVIVTQWEMSLLAIHGTATLVLPCPSGCPQGGERAFREKGTIAHFS